MGMSTDGMRLASAWQQYKALRRRSVLILLIAGTAGWAMLVGPDLWEPLLWIAVAVVPFGTWLAIWEMGTWQSPRCEKTFSSWALFTSRCQHCQLLKRHVRESAT